MKTEFLEFTTNCKFNELSNVPVDFMGVKLRDDKKHCYRIILLTC